MQIANDFKMTQLQKSWNFLRIFKRLPTSAGWSSSLHLFGHSIKKTSPNLSISIFWISVVRKIAFIRNEEEGLIGSNSPILFIIQNIASFLGTFELIPKIISVVLFYHENHGETKLIPVLISSPFQSIPSNYCCNFDYSSHFFTYILIGEPETSSTVSRL